MPRAIVGKAVIRTGVPVRMWCCPGNTGHSALIRQVKTEMREWNLARVVWVANRGFASTKNKRFLQQSGGGYILDEKRAVNSSRRCPAGRERRHRRR